MANDTRQLILDKSYELLKQYGYTATSMRQIAAACGILPGNLYYYFKKKEDIFMYFVTQLFTKISDYLTEQIYGYLEPWVNYIVREYVFLYKSAFDPIYLKSFVEVINIPTLRREYILVHYNQFKGIFGADFRAENGQDPYLSELIFCAAEFQLMDTYSLQERELDFDGMFIIAIKTQMSLLGVYDDLQNLLIAEATSIGKELLASNPDFMQL